MKSIFWVIAICVTLFWITIVAFFVSFEIPILKPEEQQKLKEGKLFWQWNSSHGPLAMHYVEKGEGSRHLLLLHGFRAHSYTWQSLIDPLAQAGYHVWAIDLIGFGLSDKPDHASYDIDFFIQQVHAFMEAQGIEKAHLVGNSMGGGLALCIALDHPECVQSLTLLSALGYPLNLPLYLFLCRHINQIWIPFLSPTMVRQGLKQIIYQQELISDEQVEAYSLPYRFPGGVTASLRTLQNFDNQRLVEMRQHYANLSYPTLVIWGDQDNLIPVSHYEKFLQDFPHAERLLIPNCGHIPQEEAPQEVLTAILAFLQKFDFH